MSVRLSARAGPRTRAASMNYDGLPNSITC
jgi:hypothetical protein